MIWFTYPQTFPQIQKRLSKILQESVRSWQSFGYESGNLFQIKIIAKQLFKFVVSRNKIINSTKSIYNSFGNDEKMITFTHVLIGRIGIIRIFSCYSMVNRIPVDIANDVQEMILIQDFLSLKTPFNQRATSFSFVKLLNK